MGAAAGRALCAADCVQVHLMGLEQRLRQEFQTQVPASRLIVIVMRRAAVFCCCSCCSRVT